MSTFAQLAVAVGVVFALNLLPAFGPPTWAALVFFSLDFNLPAVPLVLGGALAAASGRFVLASAARNLGSLLPDTLTSPLGMLLQVAMLAGLALLAGGIRPSGPSSPAPRPAGLKSPKADRAPPPPRGRQRRP
jgi:hypothetical protein